MKIRKGDYYLIRRYGKPAIARILTPNKKDKPIKIETLLVFIDCRVVRHQVATAINRKNLTEKMSYRNKVEGLEVGRVFLEDNFPEYML
ncbi:MAG: hypothetical protein DRH57_09465 [Candidatus Cloacimonadota bacterium]|nr:MAG: hypothetical protein DRH57_09465 [Candidatus Cloacimonadota bacterium]